MHRLLLLCFLFFRSASPREVCPSFISCDTSEQQHSCPPATFYRHKVKLHRCCPGCVPLKGPQQSCTTPEECQPGLTCTTRNLCEEDPSQACEFYKRNDPVWNKNRYWTPQCLTDGSYSPKQCKGEKMAGKCFCVSADGRRIFGEEEWSASEMMSCDCSRRAEVLRRAGSEVHYHCSHEGNYEPLQCTEKVCWCAHPITGVPYTAMVPVAMMIGLPCYNRSAVGSQYYRQCESANHIQELTKRLLSSHGTTGLTWALQRCNFDGSYHRVQPLGQKTRCAYINNSPLTEAVASRDANCNCAYDRHLASLRRADFFADCLPNGNYRARQMANDKPYCLDQDGFHFSDDPGDCPV